MNKLHTAVILTCLLALAGCHTLGIKKKRVDYKAASASARTSSLEVPPDLTKPETKDRYAVPEGNGESVESYSDYARSADGQPQQHVVSSNVLPPIKGVHIEHHGTQHWLVVDGPAESVWPKVKQFWQANGFKLKTDDPRAGIMETNWLENRANIPQGGVRSLLGKVFSDVYDSGTRDRFLTRFERSADGTHTNIYITHYGMQEVLTGADKDSSRWEPRPRDPELEASMLQMLMASLGGNGNGGSAAAGSGQAAAAGVQPVLQRLSDGSTAIVLREPFGRCWQSVESGLDQAGLSLSDKDRASGMLYLRPKKKESSMLDELEFWKSEEQPSRIQVMVHQGATGCMVTASTADGGSNADSGHVIHALYRALAQAAPVAPVPATAKQAAAAPAFRSAPPRLNHSSSNKTILLSESMDLCWNDTLSALDRAKMAPVDTDRPAGKFFLPAADRDQNGSWLGHLEFWKNGDIKMARPEVVIRAVSGGCEISANDGNGGTNDATQGIIDTLYQNLNR